jgi:predicted nuclease with TOPRIM domain
MSDQERSGSKVMEVVARLDTLKTTRSTRNDALLKWAVTSARSIKEAFDEYVSKEIAEMKEIVTMLASVHQDVSEERNEVRSLESEYHRINDKLNRTLEAANRNKIKTIEYPQTKQADWITGKTPVREEGGELDALDMLVIVDSFGLVGKVEELRKKSIGMSTTTLAT